MQSRHYNDTSPKEFPLLDVLALSFSVFEHLDNNYLRNDIYEEFRVTKFSNYNIIRMSLRLHNTWSQNTGSKVVFVEVNDTHRKTAQDAITHFSGLMFKFLKNEGSSYERKVYELINQENVTEWDLNIMASMPSVYYSQIAMERVQANQFGIPALGNPGNRITFTGKIILKKYAETYASWSYTLTNDFHIVSFFTNKCELGGINDYIMVKGTIKRIGFNSFHGCDVTQLNYVKKQ
jgi:hypothetical protein